MSKQCDNLQSVQKVKLTGCHNLTEIITTPASVTAVH